MNHNSRPGKGSCDLIQLVGQRRRKGGGMMMGRIGDFEGCRLVGVGVVGNRIGPWEEGKEVEEEWLDWRERERREEKRGFFFQYGFFSWMGSSLFWGVVVSGWSFF